MRAFLVILFCCYSFNSFAIRVVCDIRRSQGPASIIYQWKEKGKDQHVIYKNHAGESFGISIIHASDFMTVTIQNLQTDQAIFNVSRKWNISPGLTGFGIAGNNEGWLLYCHELESFF